MQLKDTLRKHNVHSGRVQPALPSAANQGFLVTGSDSNVFGFKWLPLMKYLAAAASAIAS
jgi:hypothetical protein